MQLAIAVALALAAPSGRARRRDGQADPRHRRGGAGADRRDEERRFRAADRARRRRRRCVSRFRRRQRAHPERARRDRGCVGRVGGERTVPARHGERGVARHRHDRLAELQRAPSWRLSRRLLQAEHVPDRRERERFLLERLPRGHRRRVRFEGARREEPHAAFGIRVPGTTRSAAPIRRSPFSRGSSTTTTSISASPS